MNGGRNLRNFGLILLLTILFASFVHAGGSTPNVTFVLPSSNLNFSNNNGSGITTQLITINVVTNSTTNITNVTIFLLDSNGVILETIGINETNATTGNVSYNFTWTLGNSADGSGLTLDANVTTNDSGGRGAFGRANATIINLGLDNTDPTTTNLTFVSEVDYGRSILLTCEGSDATSNVVNATLSIQPVGLAGFRRLANATTNVSFIFRETRNIGTYSVNCSIIDGTGSQNSSVKSFNVRRERRNPPYVSPDNKPLSKKIIGSGRTVDIGLLGDSVSRLMAKGAKIIFTLHDEEHSLRVKDLKPNSVDLVIRSELIEASLSIGDKENYDISGDGTDDISVELYGIFRGKADIIITDLESVHTDIPDVPDVDTPEQIPEDFLPEQIRKSFLTIIVIFAIVLVLVYIFVKFRGRSKKLKFTSHDLGGRSSGYSYDRQRPPPPSGGSSDSSGGASARYPTTRRVYRIKKPSSGYSSGPYTHPKTHKTPRRHPTTHNKTASYRLRRKYPTR